MAGRPHSRRSVLQALGVAGTGVLGLGSLSSRGTGTHSDPNATDGSMVGWTSYHFDPANTGYNPDGAGLDDPLYRWQTNVGRDVTRPVVGEDNVYTVEVGSEVTAIDRRTGKTRWNRTVDGEVDTFSDETALAVADETLFAVLGSCLYAFDAMEGTLEWTRHMDHGELSTPTVADGTVFMAAEDGAFLALAADSGATRWRVEDDVGSINMGNDSRKAPAVAPDGSAVYFVTGDDLYALDPAEGTERWHVAADAYMAPVAGDAVYLVSRGAVRAYAHADGALRWERTFEDSVQTAPTVADGRVFVQHYPSVVRALDASTGETLWTTDLELPELRQTLVADADNLYVPLQSTVERGAGVLDELVALDPSDGTERWRFTRRYIDTVGSEPMRTVVAEDALYSVVDDRVIYRIEDRPERLRWRAEIDDEPDRAVVAGNRSVYAASTSDDDGRVTAFDAENGAQRWEVEADVTGRPVTTRGYCVYANSPYITARDRADGSIAWRTHLVGDVRCGLHLHDGTLYVGWGSPGNLYAVDVADGRQLWETAEGECRGRLTVGSTTPAVAGDTLFAEVDGGLAGYDVADGTELWRSDRRVYSLAGGPDVAVAAWRGTVHAVRPDGVVAWARDLGADVTGLTVLGDGSTAVAVARTAAGSSARYEALSLADGSPVWEFTADAGPISMPVTANGTAYAATGNGHLHAFDPGTGEVQASYDAFHGLHGRPAVADGTVAVPCDEGFLYGFEELS